MSADELSVSREGDVHQALLLEEHVHDGEDGGPVVVPLQAELLAARHAAAAYHQMVLQSEEKCQIQVFDLQ